MFTSEAPFVSRKKEKEEKEERIIIHKRKQYPELIINKFRPIIIHKQKLCPELEFRPIN